MLLLAAALGFAPPSDAPPDADVCWCWEGHNLPAPQVPTKNCASKSDCCPGTGSCACYCAAAPAETASANAEMAWPPLSFLVLGDWGGSSDSSPTTAAQVANGQGMAAVAANLSAQFVMAVGDNFYSTGIHGDDHAQRFVDTFEKCYTEDALDLPWYALAGNHDHHGNVSAQIAYTHDQSRWTFPDYWYTFNRTAAGVTTQVIMIDTVTLCGMAYMDEATGEVVSGEAHPMQARAGEQLAWIEATLKASTADYVWVSGHYPVYSQCQHGPTACLISQVLPLMRQYGASGFIAGHDHCLGHYNGVGPDDGMAFVLSGAGKECCYRPDSLSSKLNAGDLKFRMDKEESQGASGGFAALTATAAATTVTYFDTDGKALFTSDPVAPRSRR